jgi:tRNA pseudouridine55 synthase
MDRNKISKPIAPGRIIDKNNMPSNVNFEDGYLILVDKPMDWTSFDAVNKIRYAIRIGTGIKKIKVGHAGTLDPMATGLLILATGKYTKMLEFLSGERKAYTGSFTLGATTPSYDGESKVDKTYPTDHITESMLLETLPQFRGKISQVPPVFSAIKIKGQAAYSLARKGKTPELKARELEIFQFDLKHISLPEVQFFVECSKGTYIRSLAHDFGQALGSGAWLSSLRRVSIADFKVDNALGVLEMAEWVNSLKDKD